MPAVSSPVSTLAPIPSLYLHIPFCARRCPYCDFAVSVNRKSDFRAAYVQALKTELDQILRSDEFSIQTIFCGGGTPTELPAAELNGLLDWIRERAYVAPDAEISLEANPENLSLPVLQELRSGGWNRLSLGVQSFDPNTLQQFGRAHSPEQALQVIAWAREAGFSNISLDLIYGEPFTSDASWQRTLELAVQSGVPHVSAYSLTIEGGTQFSLAVEKGKLLPPDDDSQAEKMEIAARILGTGELERYEISNWAKAGFECSHNCNYWRGGDYGAAGCGAHGHRNGHRWWNERDSKTYVHRLEQGQSPQAGHEFLTASERLTESVALGLRTREGFDANAFEDLTQNTIPDNFWRHAQRLVIEGAIEVTGRRLRAQKNFWALADGLAARLLN